MTTLAQIATRAANALADAGAATWSAATLQEWVNEAIRDYSQHFPATITQTLLPTTGDHDHALNSRYQGILLVEYPVGEDPPQYLTRLSRSHPDFWLSDDYYDIEPSGTSSDGPTLYISANPTTGEQIKVTMHASHEPVTGATSLIPVYSQHEHLLVLFVVWKAHA